MGKFVLCMSFADFNRDDLYCEILGIFQTNSQAEIYANNWIKNKKLQIREAYYDSCSDESFQEHLNYDCAFDYQIQNIKKLQQN